MRRTNKQVSTRNQ